MLVKEREMPVGYDKLSLDHEILLDLPFREGTGIITRDIAKPHHQDVDLVGVPTWVSLANGLGVLDFNGAGDYLECATAATADLDFTTSDYSIGGWINWASGNVSQIIIGRYFLDNNGWEIYLTEWLGIFSLTNRHHHSGTVVDGHPRTAFNSQGWTQGTWHFMGISRSGNVAEHYRNGMDLATTFSTGGLVDPEPCNQDMVIGARYTKNADYFNNMMWRPRVWSRSLEPWEWLELFNFERHLFDL